MFRAGRRKRGKKTCMNRPFDLVLASASPRRRELLARLGLALKVAPVDLDETPHAGENAGDYVRRLAAAKCDAAVAALPAPSAGPALGVEPLTVLGADTIVILDGDILGKPRDIAEARAMLGRLAGRRHEVTTAYRIWRGRPGGEPGAARVIDRAVTTLVSFRLLQPAEIDAYASNGEWEGKAGGYAVQGIAALFVTELRGSPTNVIGLPLAEVIADLLAAGALADYPRAGFGAPSSAPAGAEAT
jgi:septum formation protein